MKKKLLSLAVAAAMTAAAMPGALAVEKTAPFTDVAESAYYHDAVQWAVEHGVTNGSGAGIFAPDDTCTRGQVVTFLWRAKNHPAPVGDNNPFRDVSGKDYYRDAVLWAYEQGITGGTADSTFSPDAPCTRGQVVTFLHRMAGRPEADDVNGFDDVKSTSYCGDAVKWAHQQGITGGTSDTTFSPDAVCSRGQIVTFLYRYLK